MTPSEIKIVEERLEHGEYQLIPNDAYEAMRKLIVDAKRWHGALYFMTADDRARVEKLVPDWLK